MAYTVVLSPVARKQLLKLPSVTAKRIEKAIAALTDNPRPKGAKKLKGADDLYRIRMGNYRVIYQVQDRALVVLVVKIGHRQGVY